ncbi:receptor-type tyrosine-protein phosphatase N2 isoform X1 [Mastomys coucha]|uniref:receptor-type tyrosine-protein phosphatase N2 isoform X1 n=2 Tax=Mastomys coucha TaxID=35658 RepID=UPI0012615CA6|nr:receptor-type tyrosine-protein phosphatase N2 isoform X1 [Mastomys coucha]
MGPPLPLLLLLLLPPPLPRALPAPASARGRQLPGRLGCLFEDGLCGSLETCVNDGVFGRCQKVPAMDTYRYEVSPGALLHLRVTLQKLSRTGFTWQDDYTQHVIAQELANLPKVYLWNGEASSPARSLQQNADNKKWFSLENEVALAKTIRRFLPYLELLSQAPTANAHPRIDHETHPAKGEDSSPENILTYVAHTSALTYPPATQVKYPDNLRPLSWLQPDELSPKVDNDIDKQKLIAALGTYTAQRLPGENDPEPQYLVHSPVRAPRPFSALSQRWPPRPGDSKDSLSMDDDTLLQSLLKDLQQQAEVDRLDPLKLRQKADSVAGTIQNDPAEGSQESHGRGAEGQPGEQADAPEAMLQDHRLSEMDDPVSKEVNHLSFQRGNLLKDYGSPLLPEAPLLEKSSREEMKKSEQPEEVLSSEEETAGVEHVKSRTYSKELFERKLNSELQPRRLEDQFQNRTPEEWEDEQSLELAAQEPPSGGLQLEVQPSEEEQQGYILTGNNPLSPEKGKQLMDEVAHILQVPSSLFADVKVLGPAVTFKVSANIQNMTTADVTKAAVDKKDQLEKATGLTVLQSGIGPKGKLKLLPHQEEQEDSTKFIVLTFLSIACILGVLLASSLAYCFRHNSHYKLKDKLSGLGADPSADATEAYQELCRQRMAVRPQDRSEGPHTSRINSVSSQFSDGPMPSPSARSSTSSWSEEPVQSNMDISTGHMILAYMEDHLKNKNRLEKEWEALCAYQAEPNSSLVAQREENAPKNRSLAVLTYDHSRILLKSENSHSNSDYINASPIMDHDPRNPAYIATQGPLPATVADFWQMVWESGCAVIVMLTPLSENGVRQCHHYWPDEGSNLYHVYEVNLVSEHIWCQDFLVRSFYLKNLQTNETRTVTQFHFLSWYDQGVPSSTRSLLDFRRKVNKCYRGRSCPIIVHCSDGAGRSGTYVLIDMVLNKMAKGAKEIDIAATLEHLRDQRPGMVQTKEQFEFALTAVAEEVNAILKALPQ